MTTGRAARLDKRGGLRQSIALPALAKAGATGAGEGLGLRWTLPLCPAAQALRAETSPIGCARSGQTWNHWA